jgi:hypothetical protein
LKQYKKVKYSRRWKNLADILKECLKFGLELSVQAAKRSDMTNKGSTLGSLVDYKKLDLSDMTNQSSTLGSLVDCKKLDFLKNDTKHN